MKKYIAYYRVSTVKQCVSGLGLSAQKEIVNNYITNNDIIINEYTEIESGKNNSRPALLSALQECKSLNATLIVAKLDRLSRSVSFISSLTDSNADFICCDFPSANKFTLHLFASVAQYERELISTRTKVALQAKKEQGVKLGAPNATFTMQMINTASQARTIKAQTNTNNMRAKAIINQLKSNMNLNQIAKYLNDNGFATSRGCKFQAVTVKRLIIND